MQDFATQNRLHDFMGALQDAVTIDAAWGETRRLGEELGASQIGIKHGFKSENPLFLWTTQEWVSQMYLDTVYPDHDPRLEHCESRTTPFFYGREFWQDEDVIPAPRRIYDEEITATGMMSLVAIPASEAAGRSNGLIGWAFDLSRAEFERYYQEKGSMVHLASLAAYERIASLAGNDERVAVGLTERERECLLWLGRGLRYCQIADRLGVKPITVEFHMGNARRKLGAKSREQALVRAVQLGIIKP